MRFGILIIDAAYRDFILQVLRAAEKRGDQVDIFIMDEGCPITEDPEFKELAEGKDVSTTICDLNRRQRGIEAPLEVKIGSQFDNARMVHECEKILVF